jgi:hypothetical protein
MMHQTKGTAFGGQGCGRLAILALAWLAMSACGRTEQASAHGTPDTPAVALSTQPLSADPCAWLTAAEVSAALQRPLRGVPVRVASAESITPSAEGSGCMYELEPQPGRAAGMVSLEVKIDGAEMEAGLGASTGGAFARAEGEWTAKWDWVSGLPAGLFAARQGHVGVLVAINDASLAPKDVEPLAAQVLEKVPDVPFANAPADPGVAGTDPDPCALVTRAEAESVLGALRFPPYRSHESTPVAHGDGASCTYYTDGHHVVVLTPSWHEGKTLFATMRGVAGLTRPVTGERATTATAGPWDDRTTGVAGTMYFLKGDRMLELQHRASRSDDAAAVRLARIAMGRL